MNSKKAIARLGAGTLAAATVVAGLAFGPAANAADLSPKATKASATQHVRWTGGSSGKYWAYYFNNTELTYSYFSTEQAALDKARWFNMPEVGQTGTVSDDYGNCLVTSGAASGGLNHIGFAKCDNIPSGKASRFTFTAEGKLKLGNGAFSGWTDGTNNWANFTTTESGTTFSAAAGLPFDVKVDSRDVATQTAKLSGTARPGAVVLVNNKDQITADASTGAWTATVSGLKLGETNSIPVSEYVLQDGSYVKKQDRTAEVNFELANLTATVTPGTLTTNAAINGIAQAGATIEVRDANGKLIASGPTAGPLGSYTIDIPAPNVGGDYNVTVTQVFNGQSVGQVPATIKYGAGVMVTSPVDNAAHDGGALHMEGTGAVGSKIEVTEKGHTTVIGSANVLVNGTWNLDTSSLSNGKHVLVVTQTSAGKNVTSQEITLNPEADNKDVTLTSPTSGSTFDANTSVTFTGEGTPGADITVDPGNGLLPVTTKVKEDGTWSVAKFLGNGKYTFTIKQVAGDKTSYVNNVVLTPKATTPITKPFKVTSPEAGSDHKGQMTTFTGEGKAGETITLHVTNFASADVTTTVKNDGTWSVQKFLGTGAYAFDISQSGTNDTVTDFRLNQPAAGADKPFAVTTAPSGAVTAGLYTFSGTGKVGATVALTPTTGQAPATTTVKGDGTWSVQKYIGTSKYDFTVEMTKDGVTESLANIVVTGK